VAKKLWGVLAAVGLALAAGLVKGVISKGLDAIGWVGWGVCFGVVALAAVTAMASRSSRQPPDRPPPD
jgi:hypothetical protein